LRSYPPANGGAAIASPPAAQPPQPAGVTADTAPPARAAVPSVAGSTGTAVAALPPAVSGSPPAVAAFDSGALPPAPPATTPSAVNDDAAVAAAIAVANAPASTTQSAPAEVSTALAAPDITSDGPGPVNQALQDVGRILSTLPQRATSGLAGLVTDPRPSSSVPLPPASVPVVIGDAPAVARDGGQLLFPLPESSIVVPATVVQAPGGELGPRMAHVLMPPAKPKLRTVAPPPPTW
jgi:hypothetical protein